ncbi:MAG: hypothetical protein HFE51_00075 [Clostridia bacterium]|nr:hypothetical protein [Clostridia bacterium]
MNYYLLYLKIVFCFCIIIMCIVMLILVLPKYSINDYLICKVGNIISMKLFVKYRSKGYNYYENCKRFLENVHTVKKHQKFCCFTHQKIINYLLIQQKKGNINSLKTYKLPFKINVGNLEKNMGKTDKFSGKKQLYFVVFKT